MSQREILGILNSQRKILLSKKNWRKIDLTPRGGWTSQFEEKPAVYVFIDENKTIVYAGETGNLRKRMRDLKNTKHHNIRRNIGASLFSSRKDYTPASSYRSFTDRIEKAVDEFIEQKLRLSFLYIDYGRKELEEYIIDKDGLMNKLNKKRRSS